MSELPSCDEVVKSVREIIEVFPNVIKVNSLRYPETATEIRIKNLEDIARVLASFKDRLVFAYAKLEPYSAYFPKKRLFELLLYVVDANIVLIYEAYCEVSE